MRCLRPSLSLSLSGAPSLSLLLLARMRACCTPLYNIKAIMCEG